MPGDNSRNGFGTICVVAMCAAIGAAVIITKSAGPLWALFIVVFFADHYWN